jgi:hypothetical protein
LTRIITLCIELIYKVGFDQYTVYKTRFDATEHKLSVSHFRYICALFLLLNTFWEEWSRIIKLCNELYYKFGFDCIPNISLVLMQPNPISQLITTDKPRWNLCFLVQVRLRQVSFYWFKFGYSRLMQNMLRGFAMHDQNSLSLTSLSLLYRFVNVLYIWILFLLLSTFWQEWSRLVTHCNELLNIISFDMCTFSMTLLDETDHNITVSHFLYIWTLFLLLKTFWYGWSRLVTLCNELHYIINFYLYTVSMTLFEQPNTTSHVLTLFTSGLLCYC